MTSNFAYDHRPKCWDEVMFQDVTKSVMQTWLRKNSFPNFLFMAGSTGVGKTSLTKLLIQTTHCVNRKDGEADNCGHCAVCDADPQLTSGYNNVVWVNAGNSKDTDGNEITYQQSIKDALSFSDRGPTMDIHNAHKDILFIVFEEAHLMPKDLFQRALAKADTVNPYIGKVVYIFLTMSPEDIPSTARQAISQRGAILSLNSATTAQLNSFLRNKFPDLDSEAAWFIAVSACNSLRGALNAYKDCLDYAEPITKASSAQRLRFLDQRSRSVLWKMLKDNTKRTVFSNRAESLLQESSPTNLAKVLLRDLDEGYEELGEDVWWTACSILNEFLRKPDLLNLSVTLHNLRGLKWPDSFPSSSFVDSQNPYEQIINKSWPSIYMQT